MAATRQKEKPLKLTPAQLADLKIGILRGIGLKNVATIGAKIGYSEKGVKNRQNGTNATFIAEVEATVKHEIDVNRKIAEHVAAEDLKQALGEEAGVVVANFKEALRSPDDLRKDRATKVIAAHLLPKQRSNARQAPESTDPKPNVYNVRIGSLNVLQAYHQGEPITIPDIAKSIDTTATHLPPMERQ